MKSGFKRKINRNKYKSKVTMKRQNQHLDNLIDPSFQGVNECFVLLIKNNAIRQGHIGHSYLKVEINDCML